MNLKIFADAMPRRNVRRRRIADRERNHEKSNPEQVLNQVRREQNRVELVRNNANAIQERARLAAERSLAA